MVQHISLGLDGSTYITRRISRELAVISFTSKRGDRHVIASNHITICFELLEGLLRVLYQDTPVRHLSLGRSRSAWLGRSTWLTAMGRTTLVLSLRRESSMSSSINRGAGIQLKGPLFENFRDTVILDIRFHHFKLVFELEVYGLYLYSSLREKQ